MVVCLKRGADLHVAQLMPMPLTVSCFSKIQIGFTFLVPAHPGSPGKRAVKRVCVCVCVLLAVVYQATRAQEFSRCYDDVNICLWTDGSLVNHSQAQRSCQQRSAFLPRVTNNDIQHKLGLFRSADNDTYNHLAAAGFWIDVTAASSTSFHWIDGPPLAGSNQSHRFVSQIYYIYFA